MMISILMNLLSITTIILSVIMKAPQIIQIYKQKQAGSISISSLFLDLINLSTTACYNYVNGYSLISYMEYPIILFQQYILIGIVLFYNKSLNYRILVLSVLYLGLYCAFLKGILPSIVLTVLVPLGTPISLSSKCLQLSTIIKFKNADSISLITWSISAYTNAARIFTIFMDSADKMLLVNFSLNTALSTSILFASFYYKKRSYKFL
ncbi:mannose-P-dolichol utilization defect 1 protein homolog [Daktulosphaira vitifoliae]|uniref:mannose-P-dolichol utilization defect 1 protein homolog n=1 Tax=Daktulosphaira vitifoliae TaxID=58002 RepID=UPI0021AA3EA1|nr:mannose-P-dolichol utilization defect 1 protein homolog [Daktulosphaira vitifoliae]